MSVFRSWTLANLGIRHLVCLIALFVIHLAIGTFQLGIDLATIFPIADGNKIGELFLFCILPIPFWGFIIDNNKTEGWAGFGGYVLLLFCTIYFIGNLEYKPEWVKPGIRILVLSFVCGGVIGLMDGIYTYRNIDDVISKRMRWRESATGLFNYRLVYSIDRLFASASCATLWFVCVLVLHHIKFGL